MERKNVYLKQLIKNDDVNEKDGNYRYVRPSSLDTVEDVNEDDKLIIDNDTIGARVVEYPKINGIPLVGDKTPEELGLTSGGESGEETPVKCPVVGEGNTVEGNKSLVIGNHNRITGNDGSIILGDSIENISEEDYTLLFSITNLNQVEKLSDHATGRCFLTVSKTPTSEVIYPSKRRDFKFPVFCDTYLKVHAVNYDDGIIDAEGYCSTVTPIDEKTTSITILSPSLTYDGVSSCDILNLDKLDFYMATSKTSTSTLEDTQVIGTNIGLFSNIKSSIIQGSNHTIGSIIDSTIEGENHYFGNESVNSVRKGIHIEGSCCGAFGMTGGLFVNSESLYGPGNYSHSEGYKCGAFGEASHAEGGNKYDYHWDDGEGSPIKGTVATGYASHAEGNLTYAGADFAHSEGYMTKAKGKASHTEGYGTVTYDVASHACGKFNKISSYGNSSNITNQLGDAFIVGNGIARKVSQIDINNVTESNALRVTYAGEVLATSAFQSSGADYAEFVYEWWDDNKDNEDRIGYFVSFKDKKLVKATSNSPIIGITSGNPSVVGNGDEDYYYKYERDEFNRIVWEDVVDEETGNITKNGRMKVSDSYDSTLHPNYIPRSERKEWDYVGMIGVIPVRDDGTCIAGQYCVSNDEGIATHTDTRTFDRFIVLERVSDNIIKVLMK